MSYKEYLINQIENTNLEFERFIKNRNYTFSSITFIVSILTASAVQSFKIIILVAILTLFYLLAVFSINFPIRYVDTEAGYNNKKELATYLTECIDVIAGCYNKLFLYTAAYIITIIILLIIVIFRSLT